nr:hypothetical protein [Tanacetum cinerariifolium]
MPRLSWCCCGKGGGSRVVLAVGVAAVDGSSVGSLGGDDDKWRWCSGGGVVVVPAAVGQRRWVRSGWLRIGNWNRGLNILNRKPRSFYLLSRLNKTRDIVWCLGLRFIL